MERFIPAGALPAWPRQETAEAVSEALFNLEAEVKKRMDMLHGFWLDATAADRILAAQRLSLQPGVTPQQAADIEDANTRVQSLWSSVRSGRFYSENTLGRNDVLAREVECQRAEKERDALIEKHGLREALFEAAESFILPSPYAPGTPRLQQMRHMRLRLQHRLLELQGEIPMNAYCSQEMALDF